MSFTRSSGATGPNFEWQVAVEWYWYQLGFKWYVYYGDYGACSVTSAGEAKFARVLGLFWYVFRYLPDKIYLDLIVLVGKDHGIETSDRQKTYSLAVAWYGSNYQLTQLNWE